MYRRIITGAFTATVFAGAAALSSAAKATDASVEQAAALSLQPLKRIVFHYDASMSKITVRIINEQAQTLRENGYHALAVAGGTSRSVKVYIAGQSSDTLVFGVDDIIKRRPIGYGAAYYKKIIGNPEPTAVEAVR